MVFNLGGLVDTGLLFANYFDLEKGLRQCTLRCIGPKGRSESEDCLCACACVYTGKTEDEGDRKNRSMKFQGGKEGKSKSLKAMKLMVHAPHWTGVKR